MNLIGSRKSLESTEWGSVMGKLARQREWAEGQLEDQYSTLPHVSGSGFAEMGGKRQQTDRGDSPEWVVPSIRQGA